MANHPIITGKQTFVLENWLNQLFAVMDEHSEKDFAADADIGSILPLEPDAFSKWVWVSRNVEGTFEH